MDQIQKTGQPQLVQKLLRTFQPAFLTGSQVYGRSGRPRDWDVCLHLGYRDQVAQDYITQTEPSSAYLADVILLDAEKINIIYLGTLDMWCWYYATQMLKHMPDIPDSPARYAAFEHLRAVVKAQGYYGNLARLRQVIEEQKQKEDDE